MQACTGLPRGYTGPPWYDFAAPFLVTGLQERCTIWSQPLQIVMRWLKRDMDCALTERHLSVGCDCVRNLFGWPDCRSQTRRSKAKVADFQQSINTITSISAIENLPLQSPLPSGKQIRKVSATQVFQSHR
jgi:hypothetical protein